MENNQSTLIEFIAEVGSNYDNDFDNARAYIKAAQANGATAVKFQTLLKQKLIAPRVRSEQGPQAAPCLGTDSATWNCRMTGTLN